MRECRPAGAVMKKVFLTLLISLVAVSYAAAKPSNVSIRVGQQKTVSGLRIAFTEVVEDSRCPIDAICIWAGNAKVKITVAKGRKKAETFELNSNLDPQSIDSNGYQIKFISLTRKPKEMGKMTIVRPQLVLSVTRIKR